MRTTKKRMWYKISSVVLTHLFILSSLVVAKPTTLKETLLSPDSIMVSSYNGSIYKTYQAPQGNKLVVHIQDAHCNPGVQHNISRILEDLNNDYNIQLIGVEAAKGWVNTAILNAIPDPAVRKEITRGMVEKSIIDGATEFAGNQEEIDALLYGVESKEAYLNNLKAYSDVSRIRTDALGQVAIIEDALTDLQPHILNEKLLSFVTNKSAYKNRELSFGEYIDFLTKTAEGESIDLKSYPNVGILKESYALEGEIDFDSVDTERTELIDDLSASLEKEKLQELVTKSLQFRTGSMEAVGYYGYLVSLISESKGYPNLRKYADYLKVTADLDNKKLSKEKTELENKLQGSLAKTPEEAKLISLTENIYLTKKLFRIKLTREEFLRYKQGVSSAQELLAFIKENAPKYGLDFSWDKVNTNAWKECSQSALVFYNAALKREDAFIENLLKQMDRDNLTVSALVTGGFHTENIEQQLRARGISYVVIRPRVLAKAPKGLYPKLMDQLANSILNTTASSYMGILGALEQGIAPEQQPSIAELIAIVEAASATIWPEGTTKPADIGAAVAQALASSKLTAEAYPKLAAARARMEEDRKEFQLMLYGRVADADKVPEELSTILDGLIQYMRGLAPDGIIVHPQEGLHAGLLGFQSVKVAKGSLIADHVIGYNPNDLRVLAGYQHLGITNPIINNLLLEIGVKHERRHSELAQQDLDPVAEEIQVCKEVDAISWFELASTPDGLAAIDVLIAICNGEHIKRLEAIGLTHKVDRDYRDFLRAVIAAQTVEDAKEAAEVLVRKRSARGVLRQLSEMEAPGLEPAYNMHGVEFGEARALTVDGVQVGNVVRISPDDSQILLARGVSSYVSQVGIAADEVAQCLATGESTPATRLDKVISRDEGGQRLIMTQRGFSGVENIKTLAITGYRALEGLRQTLSQEDKAVVIDVVADRLPETGTAEYKAVIDDARRLAGLRLSNGAQAVFIRIVDSKGNVAKTEDATLDAMTEAAGKVEDARVIAVVNNKDEEQKGVKRDHYMPASEPISASILILAAAIRVDDTFLDNGDIKTLDLPVRTLYLATYQPQQQLTPDNVTLLHTNPWAPSILGLIIFSATPVADYDIYRLMWEMAGRAA